MIRKIIYHSWVSPLNEEAPKICPFSHGVLSISITAINTPVVLPVQPNKLGTSPYNYVRYEVKALWEGHHNRHCNRCATANKIKWRQLTFDHQKDCKPTLALIQHQTPPSPCCSSSKNSSPQFDSHRRLYIPATKRKRMLKRWTLLLRKVWT
jgi:hypothetical protein